MAAGGRSHGGAGVGSGNEEFMRLGMRLIIGASCWLTATLCLRVLADPLVSAARRQKLYLASDGAATALLDHWQPAGGHRLMGRLHHVGAKAFERLKLTNLKNRKSFSCEWRLCQQVLPLLLPYLGRRVLRTSDEPVFELAMREGLRNEMLQQLEAEGRLSGLSLCADANGVLLPGGAALCLVDSVALACNGGERYGKHTWESRPAESAAAVDEAVATASAVPSAALACVACVLSPAGLTVWAPKEEVRGILELLQSDELLESDGDTTRS